jgi:putative ABC transport system permease protein
MNSMLIKLAWANLFRNRKRNSLSLLAVVLGYLGMSVFFDYVFWAEKWMTTLSVYVNHNGHVTLFKEGMQDKFFSKPRRFLINSETQKKIAELAAADPRVEFVGRYIKGVGLVTHQSAQTAFVATGVDLSIEDRLLEHPQVKTWASEFVEQQYQGRLYHAPTSAHSSPVAVTGKMGRLLGVSHPTLGASSATTQAASSNTDVQLVGTSVEGALSAQDAQVVSRFSTGLALSEDTALMTSLETLQKLYDTDGVAWLALYLKDRSQLRSFYRDFSVKLKDAGINLKALPYSDALISPFYVGVTQFIYSAAAFFLILVSTVVVISLANTISMTVVERTREIGTLRSIGYLPQTVVRLFQLEGAMLLTMGLGVGLGLNHLAAYWVNHFTNFRFAPPGIAGDAQFLIVTNATVSVFLGLVFFGVGLVAVTAVVRRRVSLPVAKLFQGGGR